MTMISETKKRKTRKTNAKVKYTAINYSRGHDDIKGSLLAKKRGRPKGADLTVIGLPRKKKCDMKPLKFLRKPCHERDKQILSWMLPDKLVRKALLGEKIGKKEVIGDAEPTINLLDENVNWDVFTKPAWGKVSDMIAELEKNPQWKCGACHKDLSTAALIICESCLVWYHLKCTGLTVAPKKVEWFCRLCYASCSTYTVLHNGIEVNFVAYSYKHYYHVDSYFFSMIY